ncbi:hypothetical protein [[Clostridium] polysaccharolyticum]|uniref:Uncharacterized protein n=1 Tax=[Clostridium] polysaccharolyticum TaxID=29364 RepID=A0A1I0EVF0_9FIRM|nr:hypothetical protein [[Clostridium] polysaccharolyticum]SET49436.1 hypothetical protein SAMN04487772_12523 [[Clostridium] polysaccharolyticum]
MAGQKKHSDAGKTIENDYYIFEATSKANGTKEIIQCGMGAARDFLKLLKHEGLPLFNPLHRDGGAGGNLEAGEGDKKRKKSEWNPVAKQSYNAIMWLIIAWDAKPDTPLFEFRKDIVHYKKYKPFDWKVKRVNTAIQNGGRGKTLSEIINELRTGNDLREDLCRFNLLTEVVNKWRNRYKNRNDISSRLTHLTKGETAEEAFSTLLKILDEKTIIGSTTKSGFIIGSRPAVCLQDTPLNAIAENLLYEKELRKETNCKVRYCVFGVRFNKRQIFKMGGRPVIYEEKELMKSQLSKDEHWRIVNYDLNDKDKMIDWTHEREWRVPEKIEFDYKNIEVLVASNIYYKKFIEYCIQNQKLDMLQEINGIVVLNTIFY